MVLINEDTKQWNEELINGIFASEKVAIIKKIPLGRVASEDVVIWPYSHDGRYTCKLGYRFLNEEAELKIHSTAHKFGFTIMERYVVFQCAK